jgi:hypothetical protein
MLDIHNKNNYSMHHGCNKKYFLSSRDDAMRHEGKWHKFISAMASFMFLILMGYKSASFCTLLFV